MAKINVGTAEATARVMAAALLTAVALPVALVRPSAPATAAAIGTLLGSALLARSGVTQHCPVHETAGIDTSDE